jgi:mannose-6-phosphate isomerase-like protein (cupin superfamily)
MIEKRAAAENEPVRSTQHGLQIMEDLSRRKKPYAFSLKTRALKSGRTDAILAATPSQWIWLKTYASGGENALHAHVHEDHTFLILQGEALFKGPHGEELRLGANHGLTIPAGNVYCFEVTSKNNLVMLRIGSPTGTGDPGYRVDENGQPLDAFVEAKESLNKSMSAPEYSDAFLFE